MLRLNPVSLLPRAGNIDIPVVPQHRQAYTPPPTPNQVTFLIITRIFDELLSQRQ